MNILYLSHNFSLPSQPGAPRPWAIASALRDLGHNVIVITASTHYMAEKHSSKQKRLWWAEGEAGMTLIRTSVPGGYRKSTKRRILNYLIYSVSSFFAGWMAGKIDIVIAGTPPPFILPFAHLLAKLKRAKFILDVRDIYPDTAIALNYIKPNGFTAKLVEMWQSFFRRKSLALIAASPGIKRILVAKGIDEGKITTVPNAYGELDEITSTVRPSSTDNLLKGWGGKFVALYAGGMGAANELLTIFKAAEVVQRANENTIFIFFGEGERKSSYRDFCKAQGISNCSFLPTQPRFQLLAILEQADVCIHSLKRGEFWRCALPNKIFDYLRRGCPLVFAGAGDTADLLKAANAGLVVEPENPEALAEAILYLYNNPKKRRDMGENGRRFVLEHYPREKLLKELEQVLLQVVSNQA